MTNPFKKYRNILFTAQAILILTCIFIFIFDYIFGNGDGIIDQLKLNAVIIFFLGQLFLLPLIGMSSSNNYLTNTSLSIFTLVFTFVLVEILLRLFPISGIQNNHFENLGSHQVFSKYDTTYFKNYFPNAQFITHLDNFDSTFSILNQINSDGIRGPEIKKKKQGEHRILLLGDSFMQSDEVEYRNTVGQQLENLLGDSVSVIQHGHPSWSPLLELNWLLKKEKKLDLDHLILFLYHNDFFPAPLVGDEKYTSFARFDENGFRQSFDFSSIKTLKTRNAWSHFLEKFHYLRIRSVLIAFCARYCAQSRFSGNQVEQLLQLPPKEFHKATLKVNPQNKQEADFMGLISTTRDTALWDINTHRRMVLSEHYLKLMKNRLSAQNIELSIVLIPNHFQFIGENNGSRKYNEMSNVVLPQAGLQKRLEFFCQKNQIPFCPLYSPFVNFKKENATLLYFYYDAHWTPAGHQLAARTLLNFLKTTSQNSMIQDDNE